MKRIFYQALAMLLLAVFAANTIAAAEQPELPLTFSFFPFVVNLDEQTRNFTVSVNIENLQTIHKLVGIQMTLEYNLTLLSFVEMINGSFWKDFGDIFTVVVYETDFPTIGILLLPQGGKVGGGWPRFPEGNGTIAAFSFVAHDLSESEIYLTKPYISTPESEPEIPILPEYMYPHVHVRPIWNRADLNADGKVDILDLSVFGRAFASRPGQYRWNTNVDIDGNQKVDIIDAVKIANDFGKQHVIPLP